MKLATDIPRAITTLIQHNATNHALLEIGLDNYLTATVTSQYPGWDKVYYVIELNNAADVATLLSYESATFDRAFLFEFNNFLSWGSTLDVSVSRYTFIYF